MTQQTSTAPTTTGHLRAGDRLTLDELAVHLDAAAVWLRQLAVAAETPDVPVDFGGNLCDRLDSIAGELADFAGNVAKVDRIIADRTPLAATLGGGPYGDLWGARALAQEARRTPPPVVLTLWQILALARWHDAELLLDELPERPVRQRTPAPWRAEGIAYLDGLAGVPGLDAWESPRADRRRAGERRAAILAQALREPCTTCKAEPGAQCRTKNGRIADAFHRPRLDAATKVIDHEDGAQ
jgi:hypothetical protein